MKKLINKKPEDPTDAAMDAALDKVTQSALSDISSGSDVSGGGGKTSSNTGIYVGVAAFLLIGCGVAYFLYRRSHPPVGVSS